MKKGISKILTLSLTLIFIVSSFGITQAQNATDVLRFSRQYPSYDPVTMVMPGVAYASGFGAYQENPAVMALFDESFISGGLSDNYVSENGMYLGNKSSYDVNTLAISHAGFLYKFPTSRGSLVAGGGYSLTRGFNRVLSGFGFNKETSITDFYAERPFKKSLYEAAYNAFTFFEIYDKQNNYIKSVSVFRYMTPGGYRGITQDFKLTETGTMGEYSAFVATELFKNFTVGVSIGAIIGNFNHKLTFLEIDKRHLYEGAFIDTDNDGVGDTDINKILSELTFNESYTGFSARAGVVYKVSPTVKVGASYQFKNVLYVERETSALITTRMDNGVQYTGKIDPSITTKYKVVRPARANLGFSLSDVGDFTLSAMVERVDYSSASFEFRDLSLPFAEKNINRKIENRFQQVYNLRLGLEYAFNEQFTLRGGYGYYPSAVKDKDSVRQLFSGGLSAKIGYNTVFNIGVQYTTWDDQTTLYQTSFGDATVDEQVHRWNIMAGLTYYF